MPVVQGASTFHASAATRSHHFTSVDSIVQLLCTPLQPERSSSAFVRAGKMLLHGLWRRIGSSVSPTRQDDSKDEGDALKV